MSDWTKRDNRMRHVDSKLGLAFVGAIVVACGGATVATSADGGSTDDEQECGALFECALVHTRCCGCGETASEVAAIAVRKLVGRSDQCAGVACAPCPEPPTPFTRNQFVAACRLDRCAVEDVRTNDLSACADDGDCVLDIAGCCACGPSPLVALHRSQLGVYRQLACTAMTGACPPCVPPPPTEWEAYCAPTKHCAGRPAAMDGGPAPDAADGE
jgi:hypothetical protein